MIAFIFIIGIMLGASGAIMMKIGVDQLGSPEINSLNQVFLFVLKLLTNPTALLGIILYFLSAMTWSYLLIKLDVSYVQPILALTYVATPILATLILHEDIPFVRWAGIGIIILGVFIVARN